VGGKKIGFESRLITIVRGKTPVLQNEVNKEKQEAGESERRKKTVRKSSPSHVSARILWGAARRIHNPNIPPGPYLLSCVSIPEIWQCQG
jgi:hypothetical protein